MLPRHREAAGQRHALQHGHRVRPDRVEHPRPARLELLGREVGLVVLGRRHAPGGHPHERCEQRDAPAPAVHHHVSPSASRLSLLRDGGVKVAGRMDGRHGSSRREWLAGCLGVVGAAMAAPAAAQPSARQRTIETVGGAVDPAQLGVTLMHEHVLVDFIGAAAVSPTRYDADDVFTRALPHPAAGEGSSAARRWSSARRHISAAIRGCCSGWPTHPASTSCRTPATTAPTTTSTCRRTRSPRPPSSSRSLDPREPSTGSTAPGSSRAS